MAMDTNVTIQKDDYGVVIQTKNGNIFKSHGRATYLDEICEDIETGDLYYHLWCKYYGKEIDAFVLRGELADYPVLKKLGDKGFHISRKFFDDLVESIQLQEEELEKNNTPKKKIYFNLGWISIPNENGGTDLCYRANELIGPQTGEYVGGYYVRPMGTYEEWRDMVQTDIVGHPVLELITIASLSAVTSGIISSETTGENPFVHLNYPSGTGKTSGLLMAASTSGRPFDGTICETDTYGRTKEFSSVYQSWGATDNATIATQAGNRGVVTVLNELGKNLSKDMTRLIFDLSEGSDKKRLTSSLTPRISKGYSTVIISSGESSLLEKCETKLEGLNIRVMEISAPITDSAEHSNRIKECCRKNNGFASPKLAQHIIDSGGTQYVLDIYKRWRKVLNEKIQDTPSKERFVEKFAALFMATAEIATEALGIEFDMNGLENFLLSYNRDNGNDRNVALQAYHKVIEECRVNINNFYTPENADNPPRGKVFGRICRCKNKTFDGKYIDEEFLIRPSFLEQTLKKYGFPNKDTCLRAWHEAKVLSRDKDRASRSRVVIPTLNTKEEVYVLLTFKDIPTESDPKKKSIKLFCAQKDEYKQVDSLLEDGTKGGADDDESMANPE